MIACIIPLEIGSHYAHDALGGFTVVREVSRVQIDDVARAARWGRMSMNDSVPKKYWPRSYWFYEVDPT